MFLNEKIRQLRKELGLTQDELAQKMGYGDRSSIAKIEAGKVDLPESKIMAFAKVLGTTPADLMGWNDSDNKIPGPDDLPDAPYYLDDEARDLANFLRENPDYKVLFDASRKVKPQDIQFIKEMIERMGGIDG